MAKRAISSRQEQGGLAGLSSRAIMGETGGWLLVPNDRVLDLDASLMPLYRKMAKFADEQI